MMNNILEMLIRRSRGVSPTPPTPDPSDSDSSSSTFDPTLLWYTPFSSDYQEKVSGITGVPTSNDICEIVSDSRFGGYLDMTKYDGGDLTGLQFPNTQNALQLGEGAFSINFWLNAPYWNSFGQAIISHRGNGTGFDSKNGFVIFKDSVDTMDMRIGSSSAQCKSFTVPDDGWHMCTYIRYDDGEWEWYLDGEYMEGGTGFGTGHDATSNGNVNVFVGGDGDWGKSAVFQICQLKIWNRYLDYDEIQDLYAEYALPSVEWYGDSADFYGGTADSYQLNQVYDQGWTYELVEGYYLPSGVSMTEGGLLEFDGSEIYNDESVWVEVTCSAAGYTPVTASVTINMHMPE